MYQGWGTVLCSLAGRDHLPYNLFAEHIGHWRIKALFLKEQVALDWQNTWRAQLEAANKKLFDRNDASADRFSFACGTILKMI